MATGLQCSDAAAADTMCSGLQLDRLRQSIEGSFCRCSHACYGSFEASHPALLPFLSCMPQRLGATAPRQLAAIASALWQGCELLTAPAQRGTAATCYQVTSLQMADSVHGVWKLPSSVFVLGIGLFCDAVVPLASEQCVCTGQECYCFLLSRAAVVEAATSTEAAREVGAANTPASSASSSATQLLHAALCQGPVETALLPGSPGLAAMGAEAVAAVLTQVG